MEALMKRKVIILKVFFIFISWLFAFGEDLTNDKVTNAIIRALNKACSNYVKMEKVSISVIEIDRSKIAKVEIFMNSRSNGVGYFKMKKYNETWVIDKFSEDKDKWVDFKEILKDVENDCEKLKAERIKQIQRMKNPKQAAILDLKLIKTAIQDYITDIGYSPKIKQTDDLVKLLSPFYLKRFPKDPWGGNYGYHRVNRYNYFVFTAGPDKRWHNKDDISINQNGIIGGSILER